MTTKPFIPHSPSRLLRLGACLSALAAAPAQAHHAMGGATPESFSQGLLSGLAHPVIGLDHFAFLLVLALLAYTFRSGTRWLLPIPFIAAALGGTALHLSQASLPLAETMIALSVLLGGVAVVLRRRPEALVLGSAFAAAGLFHGYAYGESIVGAEATPLLAYLIGFSLIQYAVVVGGIRLLDLAARRSEALQGAAMRIGGGLASLAGGLFLAANLA
ncbi:MAG: HupE/UreJ family protein [Chromatiales bacterium]|jgi:urease accessory protein